MDNFKYGERLSGLNTKEGQIREKEAAGISGTDFLKFIDNSTPQRQAVGIPGLNDSKYDKEVATMGQLENLSNLRGQYQSGIAQLSAGLAKGAILAGTTYLDGLAGLTFGVGTAISEKRWSGLWNNAVSNTLQNINKLSEELLPNYYTDAEKERHWTENIFSANFIGDKLIKNLGFTVGAFHSGNAIAAGLAATKLPKLLGTLAKSSRVPGIVTSGVGATFSALNEGRIEANHNSKEWYDYQKVIMDDAFKTKLEEINSYAGDEESKQLLLNDQTQKYEASLAKLNEDRLKMGNADLLMNMAILPASNIIQFGRMYANGFKTARKATNIVDKAGKLVSNMSTPKNIGRALLNPLSEGSEEMAQAMASEISGKYYEDDITNFYKAKIDPTYEQKTLSWMKSAASGINETLNDSSAWEEFFIGSLTGALGMPRFRSMKSKEGSYRSPLTFEGGIIGEYKEKKEQMDRENKIADYINNRMASPEFKNYYQGLIRHNKYQGDMNKAAIDNSEFDYKNAEYAQLISDITMFDNAGKLEDLKAMIESSFDTSPEGLEAIRELTSSEVQSGEKTKIVGPFIDANGSPVSDEVIVKKLTENKEHILNTIKDFTEIKDKLDIDTGERFTDDQLTELTWIKSQINDWKSRAQTLAKETRIPFTDIYNKLQQESNDLTVAINKEGTSHKEPTERYNHLTTLKKNIDDTSNQLSTLLDLSDEKLAEKLGSDLVGTEKLKSMINTPNLKYTADIAKSYLNKINDIRKLHKGVNSYTSKFNQYITNSDSLAEAQKEAEDAVLDAVVNAQVTSIENDLSEVSNVTDLRASMNRVDRSISELVLNKIKKDKNHKLNKVVKEYENLETLASTVESVANLENGNSTYLAAADIISGMIHKAETLQDAITALELMSTPRESMGDFTDVVKTVAEEVLKSYEVIKESQQTTKKDEKKPKKNPSVKKKGFSFEDLPSTPESDPLSEEEAVIDADKLKEEPSPIKATESESKEPTGSAPLVDKTTDELAKIATSKSNEVDNATRQLAAIMHDDKLLPPVGESLPSVDVPTTKVEQQTESKTPTFRSDAHIKYDINPLKDFKQRRAVRNVSKEVFALDLLNSFDFVDAGKLADILKGNPHARIYYIIPQEGELSKEILLGIEVPSNMDNFSSIRIKNINYQIIGTLKPSSDDKAQTNAVNLKKALLAERGDNTDPYFISSKFHTKVKRIYSGRMVKSSSTQDVSIKPVNKDFLRGTTFHLGIYYNSDVFKTPTLDEYQEIVRLNTNNFNPRVGSIWLMTKEADGKYYPKAVQTKRFTESEYPLATYENTQLVKNIRAYIKTIVTSKNDTERSLAKYSLERLLYFPSETPLLFTGNIVSIKGIANNIGKDLEVEEKINAIMEVLQSDELNLRFQIVTADLNNPEYVDSILEAEILTTDLLLPTNVNSSFEVYLTNLDSGEPMDVQEEITTGHTGNIGINNTISSTTIIKDSNRYELFSDNTIKFNHEVITDQNTISELLFIDRINKGLEKTIDGSDNLYIGNYPTGTEFGVLNNKIKKGKELMKLKDKAIKRAEKEKSKANVNELFEAASQEDISKLMGESFTEKSKSEDSLFEAASADDYAKLLGIEPTDTESSTPTITEIIPNKPKEDPAPKSDFYEKIIGITNEDQLDKQLEISFDSLVRQNRGALKELGFTLKDFIAYVKDPVNSLPDVATINSQETFDALLNTVKNCR